MANGASVHILVCKCAINFDKVLSVFNSILYFSLQQGDCVISNVLTLDLTQYEDPHAHEEDEMSFQHVRWRQSQHLK